MLKKIPKHKYFLALCDYALLIASFYLAVSLRFSGVESTLTKPVPGVTLAAFAFIAVYAAVWIGIFHHFNLYKINIFLTVVDQFVALFKAIGYGVIGLIVLSFIIKGISQIESRLIMAYYALTALGMTFVFRTVVFQNLFAYLSERRILQRRVLIVGAGKSGQLMAANLMVESGHGISVAGFIDDNIAIGTPVFDGLKVLGAAADLKALAAEHRIDEILIVIDNISYPRLTEMLDLAKATGALVRISSQLYDIVPNKLFVEHYLGVPVITMSQNHDHTLTLFYKRAFDIFFSLAGLLALAVPFLLIAAIIKLTSKGSVFFKQVRIGRGGKPFDFYKFRSMYANNDDRMHREYVKSLIKEGAQDGKKQTVIDESGKVAVKKMTNDPRVTPIGRFLRKTSIDELPQLINVLRGEMSLVGPRPCMPYEWEMYEAWHRRRLSVTPGCTGLWQVSGRSTVGFNDMVVLDLYYIDNMSPLMDLKLILKTLPVMLLAKGGY